MGIDIVFNTIITVKQIIKADGHDTLLSIFDSESSRLPIQVIDATRKILFLKCTF